MQYGDGTGIYPAFIIYTIQKPVTIKKSTGLSMSKRHSADFAYAYLKFNFKFWGCLRPVWPLKSNICSFLFKYHFPVTFFHLRLLRVNFVIDLILLQKQGFKTLSYVLNTTLRLGKFYWVQIHSHWPCQLSYWGYWPQIHQCLGNAHSMGFCQISLRHVYCLY